MGYDPREYFKNYIGDASPIEEDITVEGFEEKVFDGEVHSATYNSMYAWCRENMERNGEGKFIWRSEDGVEVIRIRFCEKYNRPKTWRRIRIDYMDASEYLASQQD